MDQNWTLELVPAWRGVEGETLDDGTAFHQSACHGGNRYETMRADSSFAGGLVVRGRSIVIALVLSRVKPAILCLFLGLLCSTAGANVVVEVGPNFVSGRSTESVTFILQNRWQNKWIASIGRITQQSVDTCGRPDCEWEIDAQWMAGGERLFTWQKFSFGVGLYYIEGVHRISNARINARLSLEYAATERIAIKLSHISNAGTGDDIEICNEFWCSPPRKFNPGIEALMLVWKF